MDKKQLKSAVFARSEDLTDFVNKKNIQKEDIQAITVKEISYCVLFYWG